MAILLPSLLQGISKLSEFLNVDLIVDLLEYLKGLSNPEMNRSLPLSCVFSLISTIFSVLSSGSASALTVDVKDLYSHLYSSLRRFTDCCDDQTDLQTICEAADCILLLFSRVKQTSSLRAAAFIHRLSVIAVHLPPLHSIILVHTISWLFYHYPQTTALLDNDLTTTGQFNAEVEDPDLSNPNSQQLFLPTILTFSTDQRLILQTRSLLMRNQQTIINFSARQSAAQLSSIEGSTIFPLSAPVSLINNGEKKRFTVVAHRLLLQQAAHQSQQSSDFLKQLHYMRRNRITSSNTDREIAALSLL